MVTQLARWWSQRPTQAVQPRSPSSQQAVLRNDGAASLEGN